MQPLADDIVIGHLIGGRKATNIARDPRVVLTVGAERASLVGMSVRLPPVDKPPAGQVINIAAYRIGGVGPWTC